MQSFEDQELKKKSIRWHTFKEGMLVKCLVVEFAANGLSIIKDTVLFCVLIFNQYFSDVPGCPDF